ncbi:MAG: Fic family protein [Alphaproteobacteria bacterium]
MIVIHPHYEALYKETETHNDSLRIQFLIQNIRIACSLKPIGCSVTPMLMHNLQALTMLNLTDRPGQYRDHDVMMRGAPHVPPPHWDVNELSNVMFQACRENWNTWKPDEIAAYLMWRMVWIHPYEDGNGRVSRALGYYALSCKMGRVLPGRPTLLTYLKQNQIAYFTALNYANMTHDYGRGVTDLVPLRRLILDGLYEQSRTDLQV